MINLLHREFVYIWYYFMVQLEQIYRYWILGMLIGSAVSVFAKDQIHHFFASMRDKNWGIAGIVISSGLGIASPLCMYGTIPIAASFSRKGMRDDWLAAFMMSSVLLNPQLIVYSAALGQKALIVRILVSFLCGITAGLLIRFLGRGKAFFNFEGFTERASHDTDSNLFLRYLKNVYRNIRATAGYFLVGILLSALFQRYVPTELSTKLFAGNEAWGVLMAATIGVPLYACGGGTIPLLQEWMWNGMSLGSAAAFMITGPATKITNLGALKIVLGGRKFILYLVFVMLFAFAAGFVVNLM